MLTDFKILMMDDFYFFIPAGSNTTITDKLQKRKVML